MKNPPMTSFASVNGPSVTDSLPLPIRSRLPSDVGRSPSAASMMPCSPHFAMSGPMASTSSCGGGLPAS